MRVKCFEYCDQSELEKAINDFLEKFDLCEVKPKIKYSSCSLGDKDVLFSVMIAYDRMCIRSC